MTQEKQEKQEKQENKRNPLVTVFLPCYNHSVYVQTALRGIFAQTYRNIQLIVIDDGSTDDSPAVIEKMLKDCPFETEFRVRPNKGVVPTVLEGFEISRGEYYAGNASDDLWLPDFVERRVNLLESRPNAVLAYGHCWLIDEADKITGCTMDWGGYEDGDAREMIMTKNTPFGPTVMHRKAILDKEQWNPDVFVEDYELYLRLCLHGEFAFDPAVSSAYRIHPTNISKQTDVLIESKMQAFEINAERLGLSAEDLAAIKLKLDWETVDMYFYSGQRFEALARALKYSHIKIL